MISFCTTEKASCIGLLSKNKCVDQSMHMYMHMHMLLCTCWPTYSLFAHTKNIIGLLPNIYLMYINKTSLM